MARAVPDSVQREGRLLPALAHLGHRRAWRCNHGDRSLAVPDGVHAHGDGFTGRRVHDRGRLPILKGMYIASLLAFVQRRRLPAVHRVVNRREDVQRHASVQRKRPAQGGTRVGSLLVRLSEE